MRKRLPLVMLLSCLSLSVLAATETTTNTRRSMEQPLSTKQQAQSWGLSQEEWSHYLQLKEGERGFWSPGLDPLTTLGVEAGTESERRKYADLLVGKESQRVEKELAFQRAYDAAWKRRYPSLSPVADTHGQTALIPDSHLAVFVRENCPSCETRLKTLLHSGHPLDIWLIDSRNDDNRLRQWAISQHIDPQRVKARDITLNHDDGHWLQLGQGIIPVVLEQQEGKWQIITSP
ncbi:TIGR03759 family integrating conjugative element protein [Citrobacter portucalensis]|uniref:TIGR03759 family integrating conjugative element protein n=1 Tax=Citrobacter portucalensis TaxID=1639133 RepID=UPI00226BA75F|nr:TIGR03759 family integrating conjugative element protein [Citrobacter portucalensis]MCX8984260.1 TIGR03759 family integrating conjugative element protein [Citrobacter portucalensis]